MDDVIVGTTRYDVAAACRQYGGPSPTVYRIFGGRHVSDSHTFRMADNIADAEGDWPRDPAYFTVAADGTFAPTKAAGGHWGESILSGPAVAGLAAWCLERDFGESGFLPARFTINLMRPARKEPVQVTTRELRHGRRARYADCEVLQGNDLVATAVVVLYQQSEAPEGQQWSPAVEFYPPPEHEGDELVVGSDAAGWGELGARHQNVSRKRAYYRGLDVIAGQPATPFVRAVVVAEATTNMVVNLGTDGIGYINGGLTVLLYRTPRGEGLGVQGDRQFAAEGVAIGSTTLFDDDGPVGIASVTALANPAAKINFTGTARNDAPGAELYTGER